MTSEVTIMKTPHAHPDNGSPTGSSRPKVARSPFARRRRYARSGFTLIELLVVIAIIALLVSILLPSLNRAKQLAKNVVCMSNLRSIGTLALMYQADYDGRVPASNANVNNNKSVNHACWDGLLMLYVDDSTDAVNTSTDPYSWPTNPKADPYSPNEMFQCPFTSGLGLHDPDDYVSYRMCTGRGGGNENNYVIKERIGILPEELIPGPDGSGGRLDDLGPSGYLYIGELWGGPTASPQGRGDGAWGANWRASAEAYWTNAHPLTGRPYNRGQGNILMFDMHVEKEPGDWGWRDPATFWEIPK
jgi:prepilin-type N-terminal cleavage/methylation domain-containing protein